MRNLVNLCRSPAGYNYRAMSSSNQIKVGRYRDIWKELNILFVLERPGDLNSPYTTRAYLGAY